MGLIIHQAAESIPIEEIRCAALRAARDDIAASLRRSPGAGADFLTAVRSVILISSSSRSGSSLTVQLLKQSTDFLHGSGEINPSLRLAGLAWPDAPSDSDVLTGADAASAGMAIFGEHLASEVCAEGPETAHLPADAAFGERLYRRLRLQWPLEPIGIDEVQAAMHAAVRIVEMREGRGCDWTRDLSLFHLSVLAQLRRAHPRVDPCRSLLLRHRRGAHPGSAAGPASPVGTTVAGAHRGASLHPGPPLRPMGRRRSRPHAGRAQDAERRLPLRFPAPRFPQRTLPRAASDAQSGSSDQRPLRRLALPRLPFA